MTNKNNTERNIESLEDRRVFTADPVLGSIALPESVIVETHDQLNGVGASAVQSISDEFGLTGLGQTVVVIDSGIAYDHYALGGGLGDDYRVVGGWDFAENDADPYDDGPAGYHGTHVAGIIGSDDSQYTGVASAVDLVALRVFDDNGAGNFDWIESALDWVHDHRNDFENPITTVNMSLGADWNSENVPQWAMLEDELAQLEQDGIFVSVSAGNGFRNQQTVGLSYPAASEFVVPVASYGSSGQLSDFSQRSDRVIAAPGELVMSTAPDYIDGFDGVTNDFTKSSGTSMAAPYVAGASILIREALEFAGQNDVTQDDIYELMIETSDSIFDSVTNQWYHRLNLEAAIETALPNDDFGDSIGDAHSLGTIHDSITLDGMFTSANDQDYFRFVAGQTGIVEVHLDSFEYASTVAHVVDGLQGAASSPLEFMVEAGNTYTLALETTAGIGNYSASFQLTPATVANDLGIVDAITFHQDASSGTSTRFTAAHDGWLSILASGANSGSVSLLNQAGEIAATASFANGQASFDLEANAGQQFTLQVHGTTTSTTISVTNLVQFNGREVTLYATDSNDLFIVRAGEQVTIGIHGEVYTLDSGQMTTVEVVGASQQDQVWIFGTNGGDAAIVGNNTVQMVSSDLHLHVSGFYQNSLIGRGGADSVTMHDTGGNDTFVGRQDFALMKGSGSRSYAVGFETVDARSIHGGDDLALMFGSDNDDHFSLTSVAAEMDYGHVSVFAGGFDRVQAFANQGGNDTVQILGTIGHDRFIARPTATYFEGNGFKHQVRDFENVQVVSAGGNDTALMYDSAGDDQLTVAGQTATLHGSFYTIEMHGFQTIAAIANGGGNDQAVFYGTEGDDLFIGLRQLNIIQGANYRHVAHGFESTMATAGNGIDTAILYADPAGVDFQLTTEDSITLIGDGYTSTTANFENLIVVGDTNSGYGNFSIERPGVAPSRLTLMASPVVYVTGDPLLTVRLSAVDAGSLDSAAEQLMPESTADAAVDFAPSLQDVDHAVREQSLGKRSEDIAACAMSPITFHEQLDATAEAFLDL